MHRSVLTWVHRRVAEYGLAGKSTLEVGSYNENGSVRGLFTGDYIGVDMRMGPGVDAMVNAHRLDLWRGDEPRFECIVCTEMLEHDTMPWVSAGQMAMVAAPDAILLVTARGFDNRGSFPIHNYPDDCWRFSASGLDALLEYGGWKPVLIESDPDSPGVFAMAYVA